MESETTTEDHAAALAADVAFDRADAYSWQGEPITWSERHNWLWLGIIRAANMTQEQDCLSAMWVGGLADIKDIQKVERAWRKDQDSVLSELAEFTGGYIESSQEVFDAMVTLHQIREDIAASHNELDDSEDSGGADGTPKKSEPARVTLTTSPPPQGSPPSKPATNSPTPKDSNSSRSASPVLATSS